MYANFSVLAANVAAIMDFNIFKQLQLQGIYSLTLILSKSTPFVFVAYL